MELTAEQQQQLSEFQQKGWDVGSSTDPINKEESTKAINDAYEILELPPPRIFWCQSIKACCLVRHILINEIGEESYREWLLDHTEEADLEELKRIGERDTVAPADGCAYWGGQEVYWVYYYLFPKLYLGHEYPEDADRKLDINRRLVENCGWIWPHDNCAFVSDRPREIHWNGEEEISKRRIHRDGGPAVRFSDGHSVWALNGVMVPKWLAEPPPEEVPIEEYPKLQNEQIAFEFIRKVGAERLVGGREPVDTGQYQTDNGRNHSYFLYEIEFPGDRTLPYLKMEDASQPGMFHLERVPIGTKTVRAALLFRNGLEEDQIDDVNGSKWWQQGHRIFRLPAKKYRFFPSVLT